MQPEAQEEKRTLARYADQADPVWLLHWPRVPGSQEMLHQARRVRKRFGGGMRQAGILAAAGMHVLDHHIERLTEDHARAERLEQALRGRHFVGALLPVETNIVVFTVKDLTVADLLARLRALDILAVQFGPGMVRFVTHLDVTDADIDRVIAALDRITP